QHVDLLEGPLEYSWSNAGIKSTQHQQSLSGAGASGKIRLEALESAFDISAIKSYVEEASKNEVNPSSQNSDKKPNDCVATVEAATESSRELRERGDNEERKCGGKRLIS
ncbi:hypothetical protein BGX34_005925, partial [Mortierella sp. NVP85]